MATTLKPVEIETGTQDREGLLVFDDHRLLAILVQLSDIHDGKSGAWYVEYGLAVDRSYETFGALDDALSWIVETDKSRRDIPK